MDHRCPNCGTRVPADARACTSCGLAHNVPVFDSDGTFLGSTFARTGDGSPAAPGRGGNPRPSRLPRKVIALVAGVFALAVVLGVAVAYGIRTMAPTGPDGPATATAASPLPPDPLETPDVPPPGPFAEVARMAGSSTHRVLASTCSGTGVGTAFQFGTEGLLVSSARVVSAARSIAVLSGDRIVPATVAKIDTRSGLALLKPQTPLGGRPFELGTRQLAVGDEALLLGWTTDSQQPARGRPRGTVGTVTETGVALDTPDGRLSGIRRMTGKFDSGLAGSPVLDREGRMLGIVVQATDDQNELLVAGLDTIADPLLGPTGMPPAMEPCPGASGPHIVTTVGGTAPPGVRSQLGHWFGALNTGDWDRARGALAAGLKEEMTREKLEADYRGTYVFNIVTAPADGSGTTVSWTRLAAEGDQRCQRQVARLVLDQSGIQSITPQGAPTPCA